MRLVPCRTRSPAKFNWSAWRKVVSTPTPGETNGASARSSHIRPRSGSYNAKFGER